MSFETWLLLGIFGILLAIAIRLDSIYKILSKKKTDGPYGLSKPYIKIGIYRIGDTGTTSFAYNNLVIKNNKK